MKKLFFLLAGFFCFTEIQAQNTFGLKAAYNNTNATKPAGNFDIASLNRFQLGVYGKLSVYKDFFLRGNLIYNQKGNFYDDTKVIIDAGKRVTMKLNYMEVSIDAGYSIKIKEQQNIHIGVGPYLAYGINGTEKGWGESLMGPIKIDRHIDFVKGQPGYGTNTQIKQIDAGLNFNIEYQYKNYGLFINYGLGLTDREAFNKSFNRVASVGLSYSFSFKKRDRGKGCFTE